MKKISCILATLLSHNVFAHSDAQEAVGTDVSAAISATWRDTGTPLTEGVWQIPGVLMGGEAYPVDEGASLDEASVVLRHNAASGTHGMLQISSHDNASAAEVHHAFAGYRLALEPVTINLEAGRMAALITPSNGEHTSERRFSDSPLALDAFLGRQLNDEGARVQLQWQGWQLGVESWRGSAFPATAGNAAGSYDFYLHHRGKLNTLHWHSGVWWLQADAIDRMDTRYSSGHSHGSTSAITLPEIWFDGRTDIGGMFARLQWQTSTHIDLNLAAEWLHLESDGQLRDTTRIADFNSDANGGWIETSVKFRHHELGARWEQLALDNTLTGAAADALAALSGVYNETDPTRTTLIYRWHFMHNLILRAEWTQDDSVQNGDQRVAVGLIWKETLWSNR